MEHFGEGKSKEKEAAYEKKIITTETNPPHILILTRWIGNNDKCQKKKQYKIKSYY